MTTLATIHPRYARIELPMLPPSVNHYVAHGVVTNRRTGEQRNFHGKTAAAKQFAKDFGIFVRGAYVVSPSGRFQVTLEYWPAPGMRGDADNFNKMPLDCAAKAGMFRNTKGEELSDAWVKRLVIEIHDSKEERQLGPKTLITIEGMG